MLINKQALQERYPGIEIEVKLGGYTAEEWAHRVEFRDGKPYWLNSARSPKFNGQLAGNLSIKGGFRRIMVSNGVGGSIQCFVQHIAWLIAYGWLPAKRRGGNSYGIVHCNGDHDDNRLDNLACMSINHYSKVRARVEVYTPEVRQRYSESKLDYFHRHEKAAEHRRLQSERAKLGWAGLTAEQRSARAKNSWTPERRVRHSEIIKQSWKKRKKGLDNTAEV